MRTGRIFILSVTVIALWAVQALPAQSTWAGSAVVGRYGEFPPGGLFAASNSFPLNSMVDVTNDATGDTARLIVVRRIEDPGVFMLLSEEAADQLRIRRGSSGSVSVQPVLMPGLTAIGPNQDLPFHPDPDINPAAILGDPNAALLMAPDETALLAADLEPEPEPEPEPEQEPEPAPERAPTDTVVEAPPAERPPVGPDLLVVGPDLELPPVQDPAILEQPLPRISPPAQPPLVVTLGLPGDPNGTEPRFVRPDDHAPITDPLQARIEEIERTLGSERVSMVPLERAPVNGLFPIAPSVAVLDPDPALPLATIGEDPEVADPVPAPPEEEPLIVELPLVPVPGEDPSRPVRPERIPDDAVLALEPAEFRAPEAPVPEPEPEPEPKPEPKPEPEPPAIAEPVPPPSLPLVEDLDRGAYYVQVAALSNPESAARTVERLNGTGEGLPVAVTSRRNGDKDIFRIYVGPLSEDERGTVLHTVRNEGFRDAFLRRE
ncbi:MAG: hypothetical protein EA427_09300 [Spirochaetaceae bacterium]|nr:MAG: hypothetical protein EA427_09300 [Spirochaetaceae bacterium]